MAVKFNPFTGQLQIDQVGAGGGGGASYIDGEVATYNDLPLDGTAALNSAWLVREASGTWLLGRKPAGIYIRTATAGVSRDADYTYAGILPDVFSDANFLLYDNGDSTKNLQFQLSGISTGTTRTITVPNKNVTLDDAGDSRTPTAHAASHASAGSDPLAPSDIGAAASNHTHILATDIATALAEDPDLCRDSLNLGDMATESSSLYALADHTHGNLTNDGKIGSTSGLPVVTTTAGAVTTLALGTAGQVLRTKSDLSGVEFADPAASGVTGAASSASDVLGVSGANITGVDANADRIIFFDDSAGKLTHLTVGSGLSISDTTISATATGTIGGSTSTDNAIVRADSTSNTVQDSAFIIADNATASPNNTVNHASIQATGGTTNVSVSIVPKGSGALSLHVPDATATGGNARGANAVDLQTVRDTAAKVASGAQSAIIGGRDNTASGTGGVIAAGYSCTVSQSYAFIGGGFGQSVSGQYSGVLGGRDGSISGQQSAAVGANAPTVSGENAVVCGGFQNQATANNAFAIGRGSLANRFSLMAHGNIPFAAVGDSQRIRAVLRCKTTTNAAVEMSLDGSTAYLTIPSGKVIFCNIKVVGVKSDGSVVATYERQYAAKNVAGTSSEVFAEVTIGTDNASSTSLDISTVDAGDYISIKPTGIASEIWRWVASVDAVEVAYGT